jgi:hypothetical protein
LICAKILPTQNEAVKKNPKWDSHFVFPSQLPPPVTYRFAISIHRLKRSFGTKVFELSIKGPKEGFGTPNKLTSTGEGKSGGGPVCSVASGALDHDADVGRGGGPVEQERRGGGSVGIDCPKGDWERGDEGD